MFTSLVTHPPMPRLPPVLLLAGKCFIWSSLSYHLCNSSSTSLFLVSAGKHCVFTKERSAVYVLYLSSFGPPPGPPPAPVSRGSPGYPGAQYHQAHPGAFRCTGTRLALNLPQAASAAVLAPSVLHRAPLLVRVDIMRRLGQLLAMAAMERLLAHPLSSGRLHQGHPQVSGGRLHQGRAARGAPLRRKITPTHLVPMLLPVRSLLCHFLRVLCDLIHSIAGPPHLPPSQQQHYGPKFEGADHQAQQPFFQYSQCNGKKKALLVS